MREFSPYRTEAKANLPAGYFVMTGFCELKADNLVWSWSSREWHRADSEVWKLSPLVYSEDIICAARKIEMSEFEQSVPNKRSYTIR